MMLRVSSSLFGYFFYLRILMLVHSTHCKSTSNISQGSDQILVKRVLDIDLNEEYVPSPPSSPQSNRDHHQNTHVERVLHQIQSKPFKPSKKEYKFIPRKKDLTNPASKKHRERMQELQLNNPKKLQQVLDKKMIRSREVLAGMKKDKEKYKAYNRTRNATRAKLREQARLGTLDKDDAERYNRIKETSRNFYNENKDSNRRNLIRKKFHSKTATEDEIAEYYVYKAKQTEYNERFRQKQLKQPPLAKPTGQK